MTWYEWVIGVGQFGAAWWLTDVVAYRNRPDRVEKRQKRREARKPLPQPLLRQGMTVREKQEKLAYILSPPLERKSFDFTRYQPPGVFAEPPVIPPTSGSGVNPCVFCGARSDWYVHSVGPVCKACVLERARQAGSNNGSDPMTNYLSAMITNVDQLQHQMVRDLREKQLKESMLKQLRDTVPGE